MKLGIARKVVEGLWLGRESAWLGSKISIRTVGLLFDEQCALHSYQHTDKDGDVHVPDIVVSRIMITLGRLKELLLSGTERSEQQCGCRIIDVCAYLGAVGRCLEAAENQGIRFCINEVPCGRKGAFAELLDALIGDPGAFPEAKIAALYSSRYRNWDEIEPL